MRNILLTFLLSLACLAYCSDVDDYNQKRREYAKKNNIANMFKLEHEEKIREHMASIPDSQLCAILILNTMNAVPNKICRHFFIPENKVARDDQDEKELVILGLKQWKENHIQKIAKSLYHHSSGRVEYLMPTQERIVCRKTSNCKETIKKETFASRNIPFFSPDSLTAQYGGACFMTPGDDLSQLLSEIIEGEAGSKCEQYGRINEDGLCARIPPTTQPPVEKFENHESFTDASSSSHGLVTSMLSIVAMIIGMIV
ncbi:unnamed protein product [Caenorhabditis brenneri]